LKKKIIFKSEGRQESSGGLGVGIKKVFGTQGQGRKKEGRPPLSKRREPKLKGSHYCPIQNREKKGRDVNEREKTLVL